MITLLMIFFVIALNVAIPVCIGVFVYKDAKSRGMEAALWTLVAVLIPYFVGLVIYLIARNKYSAMRCACCGAVVEEDYSVCPQCGTNLRASCPSCGRMVQPDWHVCAHCGTSLTQVQESYIVKPASVGKSLWIALGVIVVLFLLLAFVVSSNLIWYWVPHGMDVFHHII